MGKGQPREVLAPTMWKPGQSGNPGGKAVGARNRVTGAFLHALAEDFDRYGKFAIARCRKKNVAAYIRAIAALCPKEVEIKRPLQEMEDAELLTAVRALEGFLAARTAENGTGQTPSGEQVN